MKFRSLGVFFLLLFVPLVHAEYYLYFMNNTHDALTLHNTCDSSLSSSKCSVHNNGQLEAFKRIHSHTINYDSGIHLNHRYTLINYFSMPGDEHHVRNNYFETTFEGDIIGSHIVDIKLTINGHTHVLLNSNNSEYKVKHNQLASFSVKHSDGHEYFFYVNTQKDHYSDQGIDSIYFTVHTKPTILSSSADNELTVITYNIQLFPVYAEVALDLNKPSTRVHYLSKMDALQHADVVVFEEAWDHGSRDILKNMMHKTYPYQYDPVPGNTHGHPLNSGLLIFSRYPMTKKMFVNYQDHQSLVDADRFSNKGAAYFRINKNGKGYNFIATHAQAQNDAKSVSVRQEEFRIIKQNIIDNHFLSISSHEPLIFVGDTNTSFYDKSQFDYMKSTLNLNSDGVLNNLYKTPKFSYDSSLNLMVSPSVTEYGLYDFAMPVKDFLQPSKILSQITPLRAVDQQSMYSRAWIRKLYHYGDIDLSDHFMVQTKFTF